MDASGQTTGPVQNSNLAVGLLFLLVSMMAGIVIMNSAVGVYMAAFAQLHQRATRAPPMLPRPTRKALPIIYHPSIDGSQGGLRQRLQRVIDARTFDAAINTAVILSLLALSLQASLALSALVTGRTGTVTGTWDWDTSVPAGRLSLSQYSQRRITSGQSLAPSHRDTCMLGMPYVWARPL
jgi:hypothetical protein